MWSDLLGPTVVAMVFWLSLFVGVGLGLILAIVGRGPKIAIAGVILTVLGVLGVASMLLVVGAAPPSSVVSQPGQTANLVRDTTYTLPGGVSYNTQTNILTFDFEFNYTTSYICIVSSFAATHACAASSGGIRDIVFPFSLIRTDSGTGALNQTVLFQATLASTYTFSSLGSTPTTYGILGFKPATSTAQGQWQTYFTGGQLKNQYPSVSAPSVSSGLLTDGIAVGTFATVSAHWLGHLAGTNGTSFPESAASALTNYTAYNVGVLDFGPGVTPSVVYVQGVELGWTS